MKEMKRQPMTRRSLSPFSVPMVSVLSAVRVCLKIEEEENEKLCRIKWSGSTHRVIALNLKIMRTQTVATDTDTDRNDVDDWHYFRPNPAMPAP